MSRHPYSRYWKRVIAFLATGFVASAALLLVRANLLSLIVLLVTLVATGIYLLGESSDLPGTTGDHDRDVPAPPSSLEDEKMQEAKAALPRATTAAPVQTAAGRDREDVERATGEGMDPGRT